MTDDEIIKQASLASAHLRDYEATIRPVAEELARRKSILCYGETGHYVGELGCWDSGKNTICLHNKGDRPPDALWSKALNWEDEWQARFHVAGVHNIHISGQG